MNDIITFDIGHRIKELRTAKGLSQEKLAFDSGITTTYLGLLERNRKNPTINVIEHLCHAMGVTLHEFFNDADTPTGGVDDLSTQLLSLVRSRTDSEKKEIALFLKRILDFRDMPS